MKDVSDLDLCCETIKAQFGIELNWYEKASLKHYINSCKKEKMGWLYEGIYRFIIDNFGLDPFILSRGSCIDKYGYEKLIGMNLIETPELKKYCQNHIQQWRDEIELI